MALRETLNANFKQLQEENKVNTGYLTGELSTEKKMFEQVKEMKRSTFDRSKFTVVGSPSITNGGVASGFSTSNYLTIPAKILNSLGQNSWKIQIEGTYNSEATSFMPLFSGAGHTYNDTNSFMNIGRLNANKYWFANITLDVNGVKTNSDLGYDTISDSYDGQRYKYILNYDKTNKTYTSKLYFNDVLVHDKFLVSNYYLAKQTNDLIIGYKYGNYQIDISQFSITVDGVEIFNGNKTGIDQIKDDYTVVGSPSITSDGIASGFSSSNYLEKTLNTTGAEFVYRGKFNINNTTIEQRIFSNNQLKFAYNGTYFLSYRVASNGSTTFSGLVKNGLDLTRDIFYEIILSDTKNEMYLWNDVNNKKYSNEDKTSINLIKDVGYMRIGVWATSLTNPASNTYIDLSQFSITVDDNLVYQPTLRIPYTQSKTGSKIVDSVYRERVQDMYEQFGQANYYTLSDTDVTLPMGEVYGMIEEKVDTNASNINADGKAFISGLSTPSGKYVNLTLGASNTTYIAPANGYYYLNKSSTGASQGFKFEKTDDGGNFGNKVISTVNAQPIEGASYFVKRGEVVKLWYSLGGTTNCFRFYYAEGDQPQD